MGSVMARAPRTDRWRAGAERAADKPMPGNATPLAEDGYASRKHCPALVRGAGPMTRGLCLRVAGTSRVELGLVMRGLCLRVAGASPVELIR
jgi:hypothetical protein